MLRRLLPAGAPGRRRDDDALVDVLLAALLGALGLVSLLGDGPGDRPPDLLGAALVVAGAGSLLLAHRRPLPVLGAALGTSLALDQLGYAQSGLGLTVLWALYVVALRLPRRTSVPATLVTLLLVNASLLTAGVGQGAEAGARAVTTPADQVTTTVVLGAGWVLGRAVHARRSRRTAEERAALAEERTLVAREMQDLVAHELAGLSVQVTAARRMAGRDCAATEELLAGAEASARAAVAEARRILLLLTPDDAGTCGTPGAPGAPCTDRRPLPGIDDLAELAQEHCTRGLPVTLHAQRSEAVAPGPGLLAYRVAELALEDAWRSGAGRAEVAVQAGAQGLRVAVRHERMAGSTLGTVAPDTSSGVSGLVRRARLYGGTVDRTVDTSGGSVVLEIPGAGTRRTS
ncbi:histidine kinase [Ornithinimicrobium pekingense]|uniref:histidine kinase n=1 Tax=Ornithinimicrobium pekingense TaxID=384677 RepID=A0ABQ2FBQ9_9MICO|nr:histidine kinase [Ornithinimicrobium pekingense]GGK78148.1 hypothetical protein GCM10011509_28360 [Ornithinimicrobium pekingense]